jgi:hypothetical protein
VSYSSYNYNNEIINWHQEEVRKLDIITRNLLIIRGQHYPKPEVDRLYDSRRQRGRALEILKLTEYVECKDIRNFETNGICRVQG